MIYYITIFIIACVVVGLDWYINLRPSSPDNTVSIDWDTCEYEDWMADECNCVLPEQSCFACRAIARRNYKRAIERREYNDDL